MKVLKMLPLLLLLAGSTAVHAQDSKTAKDSKGVYTFVEKMPEFPGNVNAYLADNIKYPDAARKANVQGRVVVKFVINEKGQVQDALIEKGVNPMLDAEALRVVKSMPNWNPGTSKGTPVKVYYRIPIAYTLEDKKG